MSDTLDLSFITRPVLVTTSASFRIHIRSVGIHILIAVTIARLFRVFVYAARFVTYRFATN
jgi:hypothetical protein